MTSSQIFTALCHSKIRDCQRWGRTPILAAFVFELPLVISNADVCSVFAETDSHQKSPLYITHHPSNLLACIQPLIWCAGAYEAPTPRMPSSPVRTALLIVPCILEEDLGVESLPWFGFPSVLTLHVAPRQLLCRSYQRLSCGTIDLAPGSAPGSWPLPQPAEQLSLACSWPQICACAWSQHCPGVCPMPRLAAPAMGAVNQQAEEINYLPRACILTSALWNPKI